MSSYLDEIGLNDSGGATRIEQTVDIMMGRKQAYHQNPSKLYIPELPHKQFYDPSDFEWAECLLSKAGYIKQELQSLMEDETLFSPYMDHNPDAPALSNIGLENDSRWSALHLVKDGLPIESNIKRCPNTYGALSELPIAKINGRSPNILFSLLKPGARIPPHHGQMNARLLVHLPLIVPSGCELRVGNQIRSVVENKLMIFDDSIEHEARNTSDSTRIVLIFDIWRPELSNEETKVIAGIFEKIESIE
jgi:aspartyl/asparaginyl beta-hydroxylase (cupin superfamily)